MKHLALLLILAAITSCGSPERQEGENAMPGETAAAETGAALTLTAEESAAMDLSFSDVLQTEAEKTVIVPARVVEDPDRSASVTTLIDGRIESVEVREGQRVARGRVLATVASMALGNLIAELLQTQSALQTAEAAATRLRALAADNAASRKQLQESEHALQSARAAAAAALQRLRAAGMTPEDLTALRQQPENYDPALKLRAPIAGVISMRSAHIGQPVSPGVVLFTILATGTALIEGSVFEDDFRLLEAGQQAKFFTAAAPDTHFTGTLSYIAPTVDDASHALQVRCNVPNPDGLLRPNLYGRLEIRTSARDSILTVPLSAIVYDGSERYLFLVTGENSYAYRRVETGREFDGRVEILRGINAGARVVSGGVFNLKSRYKLALEPEEE
jgi:RND family efflux transporter MFP subunit